MRSYDWHYEPLRPVADAAIPSLVEQVHYHVIAVQDIHHVLNRLGWAALGELNEFRGRQQPFDH